MLVVGATGATGTHLVRQLLDRGHRVRAVVRSSDKLPSDLKAHAHLSLIEGSLLDFSDKELQTHVAGCAAVASCLGHIMSAKGIWGHPRLLCTDATRRLCTAIEASEPDNPVRFVLMNTVGNANRDQGEEKTHSCGHSIALSLLRNLAPPHHDNEQAAQHLVASVGKSNTHVEWVVVRPDALVDDSAVTPYTAHASPLSNPLSNPGKTSRINVAHFMADLMSSGLPGSTFVRWKSQMPVLYNDNAHPK
jgi:nucleoside-diphosphate-sugar epimerase